MFSFDIIFPPDILFICTKCTMKPMSGVEEISVIYIWVSLWPFEVLKEMLRKYKIGVEFKIKKTSDGVGTYVYYI